MVPWVPTLGACLAGYYDENPLGQQYDPRKHRFKQNPQLRSSGINHTLAFRGSFNPPHRGHLAVLEHAFRQTAQELNVVAALIYPPNDESLGAKYEATTEPRHIISFEDRARLWSQEESFPPWAWVYEPCIGGWSNLMKYLSYKVACNIRFIYLYGPDKFNVDEEYFDERMMVTDIARKADWHETGEPSSFEAFGPWEMYQKSIGQEREEPGAENGEESSENEEIEEEGEETQEYGEVDGIEEPDAVEKRLSKVEEDETEEQEEDEGWVMAEGVEEEEEVAMKGEDEEEEGDEVKMLDEEHQSHAMNPMKQKYKGPISTQFSDHGKLDDKAPSEQFSTQLVKLSDPSTLYICWNRTSVPRRSFRFLSATSERSAPFRSISPSALQNSIHQESGRQLKSTLDKMALSPDLLWELLQAK